MASRKRPPAAAERSHSAEPPHSRARHSEAEDGSRSVPPRMPEAPAASKAPPEVPAAAAVNGLPENTAAAAPPPPPEQGQQRFFLLAPEEELAAAEEPTANASLAALDRLAEYERQLRLPPDQPPDFSPFLPQALHAMARSKWRVVATEKANFGELLSGEPPAPQPRRKQPFSDSLLRRAFYIRRREGPAAPAVAAALPPFPHSGGRPTTVRRLRRPLRATGELSLEDVRDVLAPVHNRLCRLSFKHWGNPFLAVITPENCVTLKVPNYFNFVKDPMNLTWMKDKVRNMEYAAIADYVADVALVRDNAQRYNRPGDPVYGFADELFKTCTQELTQLGYTMPKK